MPPRKGHCLTLCLCVSTETDSSDASFVDFPPACAPLGGAGGRVQGMGLADTTSAWKGVGHTKMPIFPTFNFFVYDECISSAKVVSTPLALRDYHINFG